MTADTSQKIWILSSNRWNSAITEYALNMALSLKKRGHDVTFSPKKGTAAESRARQGDLAVEAFSQFGLLDYFKARALATEIQPTVTITMGGPESLFVNALKLPGSYNLRFRGQDQDMTTTNPTRFNRGLRNFHHLLVPCQVLQDKIESRVPVTAVTLGIDTAKYFHQLMVPPDKPCLLIFGRFDPIKGHREFLQIFAQTIQNWSANIPKPVCSFIGLAANLSGTDLNQEIQNLGLSPYVKVVEKRVADVPKLMTDTTLGIIPSLGSEVICRVAEEFLCCGTPIFVSGVGALEETLFSGAGASFRGLSTLEAAQKLEQLIVTSYQETESNREARAKVAQAKFSYAAMAQALESLFPPKR